MKIVFFTFYYPPDLCAGSFRAIALAQALSEKLEDNDELHIVTTQPNRYENYRVKADSYEIQGNVRVHRITVPAHKSGMFSQACTFASYACSAYKLTNNLNPDFLIGTTSRLMTGILTGLTAYKLGCKYFIDLRDIFSDTISDIFSQKSRLLGFISKITFSSLERWLLNKAVGVNVVSAGFPQYFQKKCVDTSSWSFFPNGVDSEFIDLPLIEKKKSKDVKTILYAGNIGSGQGLETVLPKIAKKMGSRYRFLIVGNGGARIKLFSAIKAYSVNNIEILPPVNREKLIKYYNDADILFLHLNDIPAFQRVLPSKIFEYTALRKPIIAGLSGYSAKFMSENVPHAKIFKPGDIDGCMDAIKHAETLVIKRENVDAFVDKFSRGKVMGKMANHIFSLL